MILHTSLEWQVSKEYASACLSHLEEMRSFCLAGISLSSDLTAALWSSLCPVCHLSHSQTSSVFPLGRQHPCPWVSDYPVPSHLPSTHLETPCSSWIPSSGFSACFPPASGNGNFSAFCWWKCPDMSITRCPLPFLFFFLSPEQLQLVKFSINIAEMPARSCCGLPCFHGNRRRPNCDKSARQKEGVRQL